MVKKYVEVTVALDDANPDVLEVTSREKEGEAGAWNDPKVANCIPKSIAYFPWLKLDIEKIEEEV